MKRRWTRIIVLIALFLLVPGRGFACSVPVFRYALERWMADYYDGVVIHKGAIADDDPAVELLKSEEAEFLNLRLSTIDLDDEESWKRLAARPQGRSPYYNLPQNESPDANSTPDDESAASLLKSRLGIEIPEKLPALVLWYPWQKGRAAPLWTGEFTPEAIKELMKSPKREELGRRLTDAQTTVWVFVESGNAKKDAAAMKLINEELKSATEQLKEMAEEYPAEPGVPTFEYEFSTLTVSRSDPNEKALLTILLNSEPDLDQYESEPIVFPVFGRGRALFALVGEGINSDNLREAIAFITGPCGCEIKMMNPGVDLIMAVDWDTSLMEFYEEFYAFEEPLPELTSVFPEEPAEAPNDVASEPASAEAPDANDLIRAGDEQFEAADDEQAQAAEVAQRQGRRLGVMGTAAVSLAGIVVVVALGTLAVTRQRKANQ